MAFIRSKSKRRCELMKFNDKQNSYEILNILYFLIYCFTFDLLIVSSVQPSQWRWFISVFFFFITLSSHRCSWYMYEYEQPSTYWLTVRVECICIVDSSETYTPQCIKYANSTRKYKWFGKTKHEKKYLLWTHAYESIQFGCSLHKCTLHSTLGLLRKRKSENKKNYIFHVNFIYEDEKMAKNKRTSTTRNKFFSKFLWQIKH